MKLNIDREVARLRKLTVTQLREKFLETTGEATHSGNKDWLVRRVAWRMQANVHGGLSEGARERAMNLANQADIRLTAPRTLKISGTNERTEVIPATFGGDARLPMPGSMITRQYQGRMVQVKVLVKGFEYEGEVYRSLSAIAKVITGNHWNGWLFFGLKSSGATR